MIGHWPIEAFVVGSCRSMASLIQTRENTKGLELIAKSGIYDWNLMLLSLNMKTKETVSKKEGHRGANISEY